ncbi:hypothetical protein [Clostridium sp. AWRP]|uniref:hypothetical protein n=1 Tax=Clostridium sp. AWRP TaxID=2212991 RepID=UPI000FDC9CB6|nr:hypothetical protein [Clostridium sp. AWRP]AZV58562.1 hypothetical protein DMR38_19340 [Clostridium sp. AWRP]
MNRKDISVKEIIERNNELRKKLTDENREYYEQLLVYIRTAGLFYDDHEVENLLMQILQDIISAQEDNQSAEEFFGKNQQLAADELIHNLGKSSKKETFKLTGLVFGISSFFEVLSALTAPDKGINILILIINGLLSFLVVEIVFFILHKSIYTKIIKGKVAAFLSIWLFVSLIIGLFVLIDLFTPHLITIHLSNLFGIFIISILLIAAAFFIFNCDKQERRIWWPFLPPIFILCFIGITLRIPLTKNWMSSSNGKIASVILVIFGYILFLVLSYFGSKGKKE